MTIIRKSATISNTDEEFPGSFRVILSAPTLDRDGDTLLPEEWKTPLPDHITFDIDHGMSVATTVGSGTPYLNDAGQVPEAPAGAIIVDGKYWSGDLGQETRSKVGEGHIKTTSVAFMTEKSQQKDGSTVLKRELLNGAFVAIPSNREALVLNSKSLATKAGARNSASDAAHIQAIHDHATALGAAHDTGEDAPEEKSFRGRTLKAVDGSFEQNQQAVNDALSALYQSDDAWAWPIATFPDSVVFRVSGSADAGQWQASYTLNGDGTATLGTPERVNLVEQIVTSGKGYRRKDADVDDANDPADLISATDAAIDQAIDLFASVDLTDLPPAIAQAVALVQAADAAIDELMDLVGIPDPDEDADDSGASSAPASGAAHAAPDAGVKAAPAEDAASITDDDVSAKALEIIAAQFI